MNHERHDDLPTRLRAAGERRLTAPPALLREAFPDAAPRRTPNAAWVVTGVATAAAAASPLIAVRPDAAVDQRIGGLVLELARAIEEGGR